MPVQEGDTIFISLAEFDHAMLTPLDITWSQGWSKKTETYVFVNFTIIKKHDGRDDGTKGLLFVQRNMADTFKNKKQGGRAELTIVVDKDFQYGQKNKEGEGRWLAYHNKEHKPYQHRFVKTLIEKVGGKVADVAAMLGYATGKLVLSQLESAFGDYLHNF